MRWKSDLIDGFESNICMLPMITDDSWAVLGWHKHYKNGILLKGGGLLDQPNYYLEAMTLIDSRGYNG